DEDEDNDVDDTGSPGGICNRATSTSGALCPDSIEIPRDVSIGVNSLRVFSYDDVSVLYSVATFSLSCPTFLSCKSLRAARRSLVFLTAVASKVLSLLMSSSFVFICSTIA